MPTDLVMLMLGRKAWAGNILPITCTIKEGLSSNPLQWSTTFSSSYNQHCSPYSDTSKVRLWGGLYNSRIFSRGKGESLFLDEVSRLLWKPNRCCSVPYRKYECFRSDDACFAGRQLSFLLICPTVYGRLFHSWGKLIHSTTFPLPVQMDSKKEKPSENP